MATLKIKGVSKHYAGYMAKHLAREHPKTKGRIKVC